MITHTLNKPEKSVVGLAWDGAQLWAGDWQTRSLMRLAADGSIKDRFEAPGRLVGMTYLDGRILAVVSGDEDNRSIHRFDPTRGSWDPVAQRCPDDTGSQLSWDGERLWLSQRYLKRALRLAPDGSIELTIQLPFEVTGIHWMGSTLWCNLRMEKGSADISRLAAGAVGPISAERYPFSFASLAWDGSGFWMSDLRGPTMVKAVPPGL